MFYILFGWTRAQFLIWRSSFIRMDVLLALEANNSLLLFYFILFYCKCALAIIFQTISDFFSESRSLVFVPILLCFYFLFSYFCIALAIANGSKWRLRMWNKSSSFRWMQILRGNSVWNKNNWMIYLPQRHNSQLTISMWSERERDWNRRALPVLQ